MPIFCKIFVQTGVEEIYEIYDVESDIGVDIDRDAEHRQFDELEGTYDCHKPRSRSRDTEHRQFDELGGTYNCGGYRRRVGT